jgi:hypothetical protein
VFYGDDEPSLQEREARRQVSGKTCAAGGGDSSNWRRKEGHRTTRESQIRVSSPSVISEELFFGTLFVHGRLANTSTPPCPPSPHRPAETLEDSQDVGAPVVPDEHAELYRPLAVCILLAEALDLLLGVRRAERSDGRGGRRS